VLFELRRTRSAQSGLTPSRCAKLPDKVGPKRNVFDLSWPRLVVPACELSFEIVLKIGTVVDCVRVGRWKKTGLPASCGCFGQISVTD